MTITCTVFPSGKMPHTISAKMLKWVDDAND
jgi:hypothetical protein